MAGKQELSSFIRSTFRSVWSLELLCFLRKHEDRSWSHDELVSAIRGSDHVVGRSVNSLVTAAILVVEDGGKVRYSPASDQLRQLVAATEELYLKRPDAVRRAIVGSGLSNLTNFSDAFRFRKG